VRLACYRPERGRTLGIVGLGKIGQAIAVRAIAMEMTVLAVDPFVTEEQAANHGVQLVTFDELLRRSDVVTVHVPMTRTTRGMIGREAIAKLKPGSIVLNVARGGVVDEAAVAEALASGHLAGAGIDVFEHEPPTDSPLLGAPNTLLTCISEHRPRPRSGRREVAAGGAQCAGAGALRGNAPLLT
jgi:D-3-phosphoglycerate dehydrogenase